MPIITQRRCAQLCIYLLHLATGGATAWAAAGTLADPSGVVAAWGSNNFGQTTVPSGTFTDIAAGAFHSLSIKSDGALAGWGRNDSGQINVPPGTFTAIAAASNHSLGIKSEGTLAGWGSNAEGQITVPSGTFTAVAAGASPHSLGIRTDGTLAGWGSNSVGQTTVPSGTFTAIAAGDSHSLGIESDGTLAGWGSDGSGQISNIPSGTFTAIAAGFNFSLGIESDGTLAGWGSDGSGQISNIPSGAFTAVAASGFHGLALRARTAYDGDLLVSYSGSHLGPNGLKANLNRNITVAGNATIQSPMFLFNNPTMSVVGHVLLESAGQIHGAGTIDGRVIGEAGSSIVATGNLTLGKADHLQGFSTAGDLNGGAHVVTLNSRGFATLGGATSLSGGSIVAPNGVHFAPGAGFEGHGAINGKVAVGIGATLNASGNLTLGAAAIDGFFSDGSLNINGHTVTIHDNHHAVLGSHNSIGSTHLEPVGFVLLPAADYGTLTAANGSLLPEGRNLSGWGTVNGAFKNQGFVLALPPPAVLNVREHDLTFTGAVSGRGSYAGDVLFEGSFSPGDSPTQVELGSMTLGPDAALVIELGGLQPGSQHDKLLTSTAQLAGTLQVDLINGFVPQLGDTFDIVSADGNVTGAFTQIVQPTTSMPAGLHFDVIYAPTLVQLAVARNFSADFDLDGDIDGDDLAQWQGDFGMNGDSEADNDGDSDGADFLTWQRQLGSGSAGASPSQAAVPEPSAVASLLVGGLALVLVPSSARRWLKMTSAAGKLATQFR